MQDIQAGQGLAKTFWLTGLSGSGKTTLATAFVKYLIASNKPARLLDGDILRSGLCADLGFTRADRTENLQRAAGLCRKFNEAGLITVAAFISPYDSDRRLVQSIIGAAAFVEIYLSTPLAVCEERDVKGLYKKSPNRFAGKFYRRQ
jgi:adenylyl-sulfate kinase